MRRLSIRLRVLLAGGIGVALTLLLVAWGLAFLFDRHMERAAIGSLEDRVDYIAAAIEIGPDGAISIPDPPRDPLFQRPYSGHYWQVMMPATELRSRSLWDYVLPIPADLGMEWQGVVNGPSGETLLTLVRRITVGSADGGIPLRIAVALDRAEIDTARSQFVTDLTPYLGIFTVTLLAALGAAVSIALRPLSAIGTRVAALGAGSARRIGRDLPDEVLPLAIEIDALLARREDELGRARLRAGDLAHGLKTPLQALMGEASRLHSSGAHAAASGIEEIAATMRTHVDRELARAQRALGSSGVSDPVEVATSVVSVLRRTPVGAGRDIAVAGEPGLCVALHRADLAEALGALTENAIRHARTRVVVACERRGGGIAIRVRDDGDGAEDDVVDRLLERGLRGDERPGGTGLGLTIASDIAETASGSLRLRNLRPGFEAELVLPSL